MSDAEANAPKAISPVRSFSIASLSAYLQALPLALILGAFLLLPIIMIAVVSFWDYDFARMYPDFVTFNYGETLGSWVTWKTYLNTLRYAAMVWAVTLVIGFWVAYFLAFHVKTATIQTVLFLILHGAISHVQHHTHDFMDTGSGTQWAD